MASGLPVILSDIEQHKEIFEADNWFGLLYRQGDKDDLIDKIRRIRELNIEEIGSIANKTVSDKFDSKINSEKYQEIYARFKKRE